MAAPSLKFLVSRAHNDDLYTRDIKVLEENLEYGGLKSSKYSGLAYSRDSIY